MGTSGFDDYPPAELSQDLIQRIRKLESELSQVAHQDIVLVAYESEKQAADSDSTP